MIWCCKNELLCCQYLNTKQLQYTDLQSSNFLQLFRNDKFLLQCSNENCKVWSGAIVCQENNVLIMTQWSSQYTYEEMLSHREISHENLFDHIEWLPMSTNFNRRTWKMLSHTDLRFMRVFPLEKIKSIQCPSVPTRQSPPEELYRHLQKFSPAYFKSAQRWAAHLLELVSLLNLREDSLFWSFLGEQPRVRNWIRIPNCFTCISPPRMSSSRMKYAFSKLKIMSSSHTDPKYLSSTSTYL